ncbi:hypothetical protein LP414_07785 [Polaromonas sp. P1(28)-13]|nr:hypothetical protein LP414_07785 [Polaromonas sp. P1(28)-13]
MAENGESVSTSRPPLPGWYTALLEMAINLLIASLRATSQTFTDPMMLVW